MSDVENQEVEAEAEVNPIEDLIDAIAAQNYNQAETHFNDLLGQRVSDALDAEKLVVADKIFNDFDADDQLELDLEDDEEVEVEEEESVESDDEDI